MLPFGISALITRDIIKTLFQTPAHQINAQSTHICCSENLHFFRYFLYLHFKCYPLSYFPPKKTPILSPHICFPTYPLPLPDPGMPLYWGIEPLQDQGPLLPLMTDQAILSYICSQSHQSPCVFFGWWVSPRELWGYWLVHIVVPPMGLQLLHLMPFPV